MALHCPKCGAANEAGSVACSLCGHDFVVTPKVSQRETERQNEDCRRSRLELQKAKPRTYHGHMFAYSFLVPLFGLILGALLLAKNAESDRQIGVRCVALSIFGVVVGVLGWVCLVVVLS